MATINELKAAVDALLEETSRRGIMFKGTIDPSSVGFAATQGSRYSRRDVNNNEIAIYKKTGPNDTDWVSSDVGGGGDAISGVWNVTPTYNPPSTTQPNYIDGANVNAVGDTFTTQLVALPNEVSAKYKVAGTFFDATFDLLNDTAHSRRIRITKTGPFTDQDTHRLVFGLFQTTVTDVQTVEDIYNDRVTTTNSLLYRHVFVDMSKEADGDTTVRHFTKLSTGTQAMTADPDKVAFTAGVNTLDIYISLVDISSLTMNPPPDYSILTTVVINDTPTASFQGNNPYDLTTGVSFRAFVGFAAYDDTTGVTDDITFTVDFVNAPITVDDSHFGFAYPQPVIDLLMGAPVPAFGVIVPASYTQVSTLPGGAAVNKLYLANVDTAFLNAHSEINVQPFGTFVRKGETVRIVNITNPNEEIDVLNIWRDVDAGGISETTNNQVGFETYNISYLDNDGTTQVEFPVEASPGQWRLKPTIHPLQENYRTEAVFNWTFDLDDGPYRVEYSWEAKNNTANTVIAADNQLSANYTNADNYACNPSAPNPNEVYISLNNINISISYGFVPPFTQTKVFNDALGHDSRVKGLFYKVYLDAAITPVAGDTVSIPNLLFGFENYYISYKDGINNIIYLFAETTYLGDKQPQVTSWNTGSETVNITDVRAVLVLDKPVLSVIDSSNGDTTLYLSNQNDVIFEVTSSENPDLDPKTHFTTDSLLSFKNQVDAFIEKGYVFAVSQTLTHTSPWPLSGFGHAPYQIDVIQLIYYVIEDQSVVDVGGFAIYPFFIDGYNVKVNTKVAIDFVDNDIVIRYINSNDVEVALSLMTDIIPTGSGNATSFNATNVPVPSPINTPINISGSGIQNTDANVLVAWYPDFVTDGVFGHNPISPVFYTRGTDYTVTGSNQITFDDMVVTSFPPNGRLQVVREKDGTGIATLATLTSMTTLEFIQAMATNPCIASLQYGSVEVLTNLASYERPNPEVIGPFDVPTTATTPALGYPFFVDEEYDPTLNAEMVYQIKNALARVSKTGVFNGKSFVKDNYAMWNGVETVPFPLIPTAPTTYEYPVTVGLNLPAGVLTKIPNFTSFREALRYIINNGKVGTILVNGTVDVLPSSLFNTVNSSVKVVIKGINDGGTDHLIFHYDNLSEQQGRNHYFENWKPYLDNIKISTTSTTAGGFSVFYYTTAVSGQTWDIGSDVTIDRNYNYTVSGVFGTIRLNNTTLKIRFVRNLKLYKDVFNTQLYPIYLDISNPADLTLEGDNLITTGNADQAINSAGGAGSRYVRVIEHNRNVFSPQMTGSFSTHYDSVRISNRYLPLSFHGSGDYLSVINAHHPVDATGGAITRYLPVLDLVAGDEVWFTDYISSVGAVNTFTVDPGTNNINGVNSPVVFNTADIHVKFYWTGTDWKYKSF